MGQRVHRLREGYPRPSLPLQQSTGTEYNLKGDLLKRKLHQLEKIEFCLISLKSGKSTSWRGSSVGGAPGGAPWNNSLKYSVGFDQMVVKSAEVYPLKDFNVIQHSCLM